MIRGRRYFSFDSVGGYLWNGYLFFSIYQVTLFYFLHILLTMLIAIVFVGKSYLTFFLFLWSVLFHYFSFFSYHLYFFAALNISQRFVKRHMFRYVSEDRKKNYAEKTKKTKIFRRGKEISRPNVVLNFSFCKSYSDCYSFPCSISVWTKKKLASIHYALFNWSKVFDSILIMNFIFTISCVFIQFLFILDFSSWCDLIVYDSLFYCFDGCNW